jgi:hypothetical protein
MTSSTISRRSIRCRRFSFAFHHRYCPGIVRSKNFKCGIHTRMLFEESTNIANVADDQWARSVPYLLPYLHAFISADTMGSRYEREVWVDQ